MNQWVCCCFYSDDFDPAPVAEKLRSIADSLNDNVAFKEALDKLKKEAALGVRPSSH